MMRRNVGRMINILLVIIFLEVHLYNSIMMILGISNRIASDYYSQYIGVVCVITCLYAGYIIIKKRRISSKYKFEILLVIFYAIMIITNIGRKARNFEYISCIYILPSIFLSLIADDIDWRKVKKYTIVSMYIMSVGISIYIEQYFTIGKIVLRQGYGSGTYQNAGYCAAFALIFNLYLYKGKNWKRILLAIIQFIGVLICSASGPLVAVVCGIAIYIIKMMQPKKGKWTNFGIIAVVAIGIVIITSSELNELYRDATSFISLANGINWENTGRLNVYNNAIRLIKNNPFFGYGIYNYYDTMEYPHNIFLEFMLQGGVLYTLFMSFLVFKMFNRVIVRTNNNVDVSYNIVNLTMLLVTSTYMYSPIFWFYFMRTVSSGNQIEEIEENI